MTAPAYFRPRTTAEARTLFSARDGAVYLGGGQSLLSGQVPSALKPTVFVDLAKLPGLRDKSRTAHQVNLGGGVTHAEVAAWVEAPGVLRYLAGVLGDPAVRNRGTLGGALALSHPAGDWSAALLALDGEVVTDAATHQARDYFKGPFMTALNPGDIIQSLRFRLPEAAAYARFLDPASRFPLAAVLVAKMTDGEWRVTVIGAAPVPFRWDEAETVLNKGLDPEALTVDALALDALTLDECLARSDAAASARYRADLASVLFRRALQDLRS